MTWFEYLTLFAIAAACLLMLAFAGAGKDPRP